MYALLNMNSSVALKLLVALDVLCALTSKDPVHLERLLYGHLCIETQLWATRSFFEISVRYTVHTELDNP